MDPVKLLFAVRIRFLNAWYYQRHTKTKQLLSLDNKQTIFKDGKLDNETESTNQWTGHYYTSIHRQTVKKVIDWDFCMGNQLSQTEWSTAGWVVTEVCVAMVNVISSWRAALSGWLKCPMNSHMTLIIFCRYLKALCAE